MKAWRDIKLSKTLLCIAFMIFHTFVLHFLHKGWHARNDVTTQFGMSEEVWEQPTCVHTLHLVCDDEFRGWISVVPATNAVFNVPDHTTTVTIDVPANGRAVVKEFYIFDSMRRVSASFRSGEKLHTEVEIFDTRKWTGPYLIDLGEGGDPINVQLDQLTVSDRFYKLFVGTRSEMLTSATKYNQSGTQ